MPIHQQIDAGGPAAGPYSDAVLVGDQLFVGGCVPLVDGELVGEDDFEAQGRVVLEQLGAVLRHAGFGYGHLVKLTIFLTQMSDAKLLVPIRRELFGDTRPATTAVQVAALMLPKMRIEIDAIAVRPPAIDA